uniref:PLAT domain-containing protein n=2 Tax=Meloidogyne hapla TaxID=6305 RepID=A0A1I8BK10_MELHA
MADKSRINKTTVSDFGNIRDSEDGDDNEFFQNDENSDDEECEAYDPPKDNPESQLIEPAIITSQAPLSVCCCPYWFNWEESALRCQNAIIRSELDLSHIQVPNKADNSINSDSMPNISHKQNSSQQIPKDPITISNVIQQHQQRSPLSSSTFFNKTISNGKHFISGTRYTIYFGFKRLDGLDSEEFIRIHNIHYGRERLRIRCWLKGNSKSGNCFKLVSPLDRVPLILERDAYQKIVISFTPTANDHFVNYLFILCQSRHETMKYRFLVHGFGGRSIITPCVEDRITNLLLSANGRYQLLVNSANSFNFILQNKGTRSAFASIFIYGKGGELIPNHEAMVNTRNVILDKKGKDTSRKSISVRCLTDRRSIQSQNKSSTHRPSTLSSVMSALGMSTSKDESVLQILIFWGEERQRQRLKQLEKKLGGQLSTFGQNFTKFMNFYGETEDWAKENVEDYVTEEEFYYFDANVKLIFIDVHEKKSFDRSSANISGGVTQPLQRQQLRVGSSLSVASSGTESTGRSRQQQQLRTIVERDPDNTMVGVGSVHDSTDDTLTLI